jgi:limonene-1,2-epoxide hydrolase
MSQSNIETVERYLDALKSKDLSKAPLAADVSFEDPLTPRLEGREAVLAFLSNFLPAFKDVRVRQHLSDGEYVATMWDADTSFGVIPIFECFRVVGGEIKEAKAFLDPRPITNPAR